MISQKYDYIFKAIMIVLILLVIALPHFLDSYFLYIFTLIGIYAITAQGLNVLLGFSGQISIGHAGFMAIGAYMTGYAASNWTQSILAVWLLVIVSTAIVGIFLGYICLRMQGPYLALVTIGFMIIIQAIAINWHTVTGGPDGLLGLPALKIGPFLFDSKAREYYLTMSTFGAILIFMKYLRESRVGRAMLAVRDNEIGAKLSGVNVTYYKVLAFVISAVMGGISGSLFSIVTSAVFPEFFDIQLSALFVMILVIGGIGSISGVTLGAIIIVGSFELLRGLREYQMVVYCILVILSIIYMPQGVMGFINQSLQKLGIPAGKFITIPQKLISSRDKF